MSPEIADVRLVRAAAYGDALAFETLVHRHQEAVFRVALRMLGNRPDAEEAVQDAFVRAWRALPSFDGRSRFSTWLYRITVNCCLTALQSRRPGEGELTGAEPAPGPGPGEAARTRESMHALTGAIGRLTPQQRAPLVLRELEGLSYEEIGEVLQLSPAAVKGRLHRARLELVEEMRPWR